MRAWRTRSHACSRPRYVGHAQAGGYPQSHSCSHCLPLLLPPPCERMNSGSRAHMPARTSSHPHRTAAQAGSLVVAFDGSFGLFTERDYLTKVPRHTRRVGASTGGVGEHTGSAPTFGSTRPRRGRRCLTLPCWLQQRPRAILATPLSHAYRWPSTTRWQPRTSPSLMCARRRSRQSRRRPASPIASR